MSSDNPNTRQFWVVDSGKEEVKCVYAAPTNTPGRWRSQVGDLQEGANAFATQRQAKKRLKSILIQKRDQALLEAKRKQEEIARLTRKINSIPD